MAVGMLLGSGCAAVGQAAVHEYFSNLSDTSAIIDSALEYVL
jgi:hypothetical protein